MAQAGLTAPGAARPVAWELLLRDKVAGMFSFNATSLAGHAVGALVVELVFSTAPAGLRLVWGGVFAVVWAARVVLALRLRGASLLDPRRLRRARDLWVGGILATGALWGWAGWSFFGHGAGLERIALIVVTYTFCVACVPILAPQFRLYLVFVLLVDLPVVARVATQGDPLALQIAFVMALAMGMTMVLGRNYRDVFTTLSRLQRRNEALVGELRAETAVAEGARGQAEVANLAKTRFFAAASHDLRQPLHAMGLFAEALRLKVRQPEVAQLVTSINESVGALEGLFSQLLDITRIDSGGVEVDARAFEIGTLFRRIRPHAEPAAFEKGLALRVRGDATVVRADPLLVERILRNLVSNAIRYTADGSVLVSCRRRGGSALLQVWDTGPGIAPAEQARIFDEFVRLDPAAEAPPGQPKGLGLGLAIVRRLAALLGAPLGMASVPGRGSVFTLELPLADGPAAPVPVVEAPATGLQSLRGRRALVVEDDPAVRTALGLLLAGWGAEVDAFESLEAVRCWTEAPGPLRPDLLIVDHQLGAQATGLDAVRQVRRRFAATIPAILVTGSLPAEADPAGALDELHLLLKPVVPNRLRAMIAFKLGARPAAGATPPAAADQAAGV